ncbi:unnamed protein product, partial [Pocillopora meandrina]
FEALTSFKLKENIRPTMENLSWFILELYKVLNSIAHSFFQWMALLASYCLNVSYYLLELFPTLPQWECEVSIDVNSMTLSLKPTAGICAAGYGSGKLRRFATPPCSTNPGHSLSTNWKWYWEDNGGVWCMYEKDHLGRNLQELIEQAFVKGLKRNETDYTFNFKVKAHEYYLVFHSEKGMHQINMQYGTKRKAVHQRCYLPLQYFFTARSTKRSRSGSFISKPRKFVFSSVTKTKSEINYQISLCRKKDYMTQLANGDQQRVNEKRLFHGTSPDSVEAICKENFDWRLSGTATGTKYGQGSYFAVKASHSHNYAKEDANKSRFMFVAKVLVGSYVKGNPNYRRPPHKQPLNEAGILYYDSCVDDALKPTMFIVFDIDQFYPEYIIQY